MENKLLSTFRQLKRNESGLAMVELAVSLPFFIGLVVCGVETANYASVIMQLNQITIHTADSAARIGSTTPTANKTISEAQLLKHLDRMPSVLLYHLFYQRKNMQCSIFRLLVSTHPI
jgi:Flp pilus assembly protein TadG